MSLQWTLAAGFLYIEVAIVLLLVLPVASPTRWQKFFKSRFLQSITNQASIYFIILLGVLVLFLLDAIREMRKYSKNGDHADHHQLNLEMQGKLFSLHICHVLISYSNLLIAASLCLSFNILFFVLFFYRKHATVSCTEEFLYIRLCAIFEFGDTTSCHFDIHSSYITGAK